MWYINRVNEKKKFSSQDLHWLLPLSAGLAAIFALFENGIYGLSLLSGWIIFAFGFVALAVLWRWAGGGKPLFWMIALALGLRLISAVALHVFLPINGYDNEQQRAGYVFYDAYRRDAQAWDLAQSDEVILTAFSKKYYTDQYGGLLALSAGTYRTLSSDAHRPLLIALLGAFAATLGVPFFWKSARLLGGDKLALSATWIFALYPESILQGSSQMREPFLISFTALVLWGFLDWQRNKSRHAWWWLGAGMLGMLLFSPAIALATLFILAGVWWFSREDAHISWKAILIALGVFIAGTFLFSWGVNRQGVFDAQSPFGVAAEFLRSAIKWDMYQLERGSGWVQKLFGEMGASARLVFVAFYGLTQPVLPASFIEPTTLVWKTIAILRSLGWYLLMPLFFYGFYAAWKTPEKKDRHVWLWLGFVAWAWFVLVSLRAGGDLWDNPRYRVILLAFQALFAGYAWSWWQAQRDVWFVRIYSVEGIFLLFFTQWYIGRYYNIFQQISFFATISWIVSLSAVVMVGGWFWDKRKTKNPLA